MKHWPWQHRWEEVGPREADYWCNPMAVCVTSVHRCECGKTSRRHPKSLTRSEHERLVYAYGRRRGLV